VAQSTQSSSFSPSNAGGSSSPGTTARRRSADFSSLKNQIALSLEERDTNNASRESKEKEARAELLREVREHGGASTGGGAINNNYRATAKLQDFGKNLLGRAKKLKGSRVGGKDAVGAGGDDDDEFEDAKSNAGTPMGSQENMRSIFGPADVAAATAGSATKLEPSPRPISVFPGRGTLSAPFDLAGVIMGTDLVATRTHAHTHTRTTHTRTHAHTHTHRGPIRVDGLGGRLASDLLLPSRRRRCWVGRGAARREHLRRGWSDTGRGYGQHRLGLGEHHPVAQLLALLLHLCLVQPQRIASRYARDGI
jgi:hypothetical protein